MLALGRELGFEISTDGHNGDYLLTVDLEQH
jgi:hypothetical protein